eukprot:CCRYP_018519-RA/>CCRYP_018519-RA protein AED:0.45 eAED:0.57 QI:0/0/0/1/0/0/3/0/153
MRPSKSGNRYGDRKVVRILATTATSKVQRRMELIGIQQIRFVFQVRVEKKEPNKTRGTAGGNLVNYTGDVGTPTEDLLLIKIFLNSLGFGFAKGTLSDIPEKVIDQYKLRKKAIRDSWVYIRIVARMYSLLQSGSLDNGLLESRLNKEGCFQT